MLSRWMLATALSCLAWVSVPALADDFVTEKVRYQDQDVTLEGVLVYEEDLDERSPAILMVPNWMGVTHEAIKKAKKIAGDDYIVFVADLYGVDARPRNQQEAAVASALLRNNRPLMRSRMDASMETLLGFADRLPLDVRRTAAIGFCFGGGVVLEYGRTGANVDAIVSFHGDLLSPTLAKDADENKAKLLILHGAQDPSVPQSDVDAFIAAMNTTDVDWQLVQFSNTVHSFTNPSARQAGQSEYNALSTKRAYEYMEELFDEAFDRRGIFFN